MTIDERLEFLLQSTESLHASLQEVHASIGKLAAADVRRGEQLDRVLGIVETLAGVVRSHEDRIEDLEGGPEAP